MSSTREKEIYGKSEVTGEFYRITKWNRVDDKRIEALEKEAVKRSEVPEKWLKRIEQGEGEP